MKTITKLFFRVSFIIQKLQWVILSIFVLGLVDLFAYYEVATSMLALLAPEIAPILMLVIFVWGIVKLIKQRRTKRSAEE